MSDVEARLTLRGAEKLSNQRDSRPIPSRPRVGKRFEQPKPLPEPLAVPLADPLVRRKANEELAGENRAAPPPSSARDPGMPMPGRWPPTCSTEA